MAVSFPTTTSKVALPVRYKIEDAFTVEVKEEAAFVWAPIIPEMPYQRLIYFSIETAADYTLTRDSQFGNAMLHNVLDPVNGALHAFKYPVRRSRYEPYRLVRRARFLSRSDAGGRGRLVFSGHMLRWRQGRQGPQPAHHPRAELLSLQHSAWSLPIGGSLIAMDVGASRQRRRDS
jgi:hypothetical protein